MEKTNPKTQDESMDLNKVDKELVDFMMRNRPRVKPSPHIRAELLEVALKQKNALVRETKLNNCDWLKWLQPIITPIKQFGELFKLEGFPPTNRWAMVAVLIVVVFGGITYYPHHSSKNSEPSNLAFQQTTPVKEIFPKELPSTGEHKLEIKEINLDKKSENNEQIAANHYTKKNSISIEKISRAERSSNSNSNSGKKTPALLKIKSIYIDDSIDTELKEEIEKVISASDSLRVDSMFVADASLRWAISQENTIVISTKEYPLLWKKIVNKKLTSEDQAKDIISSLIEAIKTASITANN